MSNILVISKDIPYPPHRNGVCNSLYNFINCWKEIGHQVDVIYLSPQEKTSEDALSSILEVYSKAFDASGFSMMAYFGNRKALKPRNAWIIDSKKCSEIEAEKYDFLIWGSLATTVIYNKIQNFKGKQVLFAADSLSLYYKRNLKRTQNLARKLYLHTQVISSKLFEKKAYAIINNVVFVSSVDTKYAIGKFKGNFIENRIGVSIPAEYIKSVDVSKKKEVIDIGFSGIMDYEPNANAVEYIISHIIPGLDASGLVYKIHIIGKNPKVEWEDLECCKEGKLVITGFLDNIESYISQMDIYISPLFLGTGMKNKILQAMGLGVPIICSEVSAEGIEGLVNNENVIIASEKAGEWITSIKELAEDSERRKVFSELCKDVIRKKYTWKKSAKRMLEGWK